MLAKLMELAGVAHKPPELKFNPHTIVEKGFVIDTATGEVIGNHVDPTEGAFGGGRPIWVYDRSIRFAHLFNPANIPRQYRSPILDIFEKLETQWKSRKEKYLPRKYFLSQALTLKLICAKRDIPCAWKNKAVIRDKKRYKRQNAIFDELWAFAKL
jgi:hypothetical protein